MRGRLAGRLRSQESRYATSKIKQTGASDYGSPLEPGAVFRPGDSGIVSCQKRPAYTTVQKTVQTLPS